MIRDISVYVHIPFCVKKCYYCDFVSYVGEENKYDEYINQLKKEIDEFDFSDYKIVSVFVGGGTPTVLKAEQINNIIEEIIKNRCDDRVEITVECNPNTLNEKYLKGLKKGKINRLSIGLQSTNNKVLKSIGRVHTYEEFLKNYKLARVVGFKNINIDLMFSVPDQSVETLEKTLDEIIKLDPEHISLYSLIIEEGTKFQSMYDKGELKIPTEDVDREMYEKSNIKLENSSYIKYEISNYSKKGYECNHNIGYWKLRDYIGFGVSSHSFVGNERFSNSKNLEDYKLPNKVVEKICVTEKDLIEEFMFLGLRLTKGIEIKEFENKFKTGIEVIYGDVLTKLKKDKLIEEENGYIRLTKLGVDLSNVALADFLID